MGFNFDIGAMANAAAKAAGQAAKNVGDAAGKTVQEAGRFANNVGEAASHAASDAGAAIMHTAGDVGNTVSKTASGVGDFVAQNNPWAKKSEIDEYDQAIIDYNNAYSKMNDAGLALYRQRERSGDLLDNVEFIVNSIANKPKSFDVELGDIASERKKFKQSEEFAMEQLRAARTSAMSAGAGAAAGIAVASMMPTAAIWAATTFGTASTGTAIATLSGAAATNAALAWLGGGALAAGGGGMAAGNALLAMAGPIGWGIAGATLLTSIVLFTKKKIDIQNEKHQQLLDLKRNTERARENGLLISALLEQSEELWRHLTESYRAAIDLYGADYTQLADERRLELGALVNSAKSLAALMNKSIGHEE